MGGGVLKGLILSGGHGKRLRPITHVQQKQLIPVANKPILFYAIEDLRDAGICDIGIVVGPNKEQVMEAAGSGSRFGVDITYIEQDAPRGLAHAVKISRDYLEEGDFVMYLGDNLLKSGIKKHLERFVSSRAAASILLSRVPNPSQFGVAELDPSGRVIGLVEKPERPRSDLALVGIYFFRSPIFEAVDAIKPSWRGELEITDAIQYLIDRGLQVDSEVVEGWWKDTGRAEDILTANNLVLDSFEPAIIEGVVEEGASIEGRVSLGRGSIIKRGSRVRGPVIIGENCVIGPDTYVGPYTSIGDGCEIIGSHIESSILIGNIRIEFGGVITESLIGRDSVIIENQRLPRGYRFIIGDHSQVEL